MLLSLDGLEEVFGAVGESVSLSCGHTSSYGVEWAKCEKPLMHDITSDVVPQDMSLVISKLTALHAADYRCSEAGQQSVLNKIRLHTLDGKCTSPNTTSIQTIAHTHTYFVSSYCRV